jgi:hypothetical protein
MAKFTEEEKRNQKRLVGMIMKGDEKAKQHYDARLPLLLEAMRSSLPSADDDVLAEFASSIAYIAAYVLRTPMQDGSNILKDIYDGYAIMAAYLIGVYDPDDPVVPSVEADLASMLGLDEETARKLSEYLGRRDAGEAAPPPHHHDGDASGQYI